MTVKLAVIGDPVAHSRSPALQRGFLRERGLAGTYEAIRVAAGEGAGAIARLRDEGYRGLNVTTPLKEEAFAACDDLDAVARAAGAVNTLILGDTIVGGNTDGIGAVAALRSAGVEIESATIVVLGAGPTARAAAIVLRESGAAVRIWNRTAAQAKAAAEQCGCVVIESGASSTAVLSTLPPNPDLSPDILTVLRETHIVIDANYGPRAVLGVRLSRSVVDGSIMLEAQGRASLAIWEAAGLWR